MSSMMLSNGKKIADYSKPYIIAEFNTSHYGKVENAKKMIDEAVRVGCDCVKFQSWTGESLYSKTFYEQNPFSDRMIKRFVLNMDQFRELVDYCREKRIDFASTPYSKKEVDFLVDECKVPFIKIASMDLNNDDFLKYIASKKVPIILSTGMSTYDEIAATVNILRNEHVSDLCILHCTSVYPTENEDANLNNILELREKFSEYPIGYSDHTMGMVVPVAATALGAAVIEKHFTLDRSKIGMDNQMATEPEEFKEVINLCKAVVEALGSRERNFSEKEIEMKRKMRRSIVVNKLIKSGETIQKQDLDAKRPGTGLELRFLDYIIGKTVNKDIEKDHVLYYDDINW